jgi:RsmE family RNA methyltransferase
MNLIVYEAEELREDGSLVISGERARHLITVLKVSPGARLRVGQLGGQVGTAVVSLVGSDEVVLRSLELEPVLLPPPVNLIVAMPRPQTLKKVLQTAAMMQVSRLILVRAVRGERSYFSTPVLNPANLRHHLRLGLEQGISTFLPEVSIYDNFGRFMGNELSKLVREDSPKLLADPRAKKGFSELALETGLSHEEDVTLAVGPEGGWVDAESSLFMQKGFNSFSCGPWVLRVETAVSVLLGQLELLRQQQRERRAGILR